MFRQSENSIASVREAYAGRADHKISPIINRVCRHFADFRATELQKTQLIAVSFLQPFFGPTGEVHSHHSFSGCVLPFSTPLAESRRGYDAGQLELAQRAGDGRSRRSKCFYELRFARKPLTWFVLAGCDRVRQGLPDFFVFRKRRFSRGFSNHAA